MKLSILKVVALAGATFGLTACPPTGGTAPSAAECVGGNTNSSVYGLPEQIVQYETGNVTSRCVTDVNVKVVVYQQGQNGNSDIALTTNTWTLYTNQTVNFQTTAYNVDSLVRSVNSPVYFYAVYTFSASNHLDYAYNSALDAKYCQQMPNACQS